MSEKEILENLASRLLHLENESESGWLGRQLGYAKNRIKSLEVLDLEKRFKRLEETVNILNTISDRKNSVYVKHEGLDGVGLWVSRDKILKDVYEHLQSAGSIKT